MKIDLYITLEICRIIALLIEPIAPMISNKMYHQLGINSRLDLENGVKFGLLTPGSILPKPEPIMHRIELSEYL